MGSASGAHLQVPWAAGSHGTRTLDRRLTWLSCVRSLRRAEHSGHRLGGGHLYPGDPPTLRTSRLRPCDPLAAEGSASLAAWIGSEGGGGSSSGRKRKSSSKTRKRVSSSQRSSIIRGSAKSSHCFGHS